jgi:hypothetical protein
MRGQDDIDDLELLALEHLSVIVVNSSGGVGGRGGSASLVGTRGDGGKLRARGLGDGSGVLAAPSPKANESKPNRCWLHALVEATLLFVAPLTRAVFSFVNRNQGHTMPAGGN